MFFPTKKFPLLKSQFIFFSFLVNCEKRTEFGIGKNCDGKMFFVWFFSNQNMIKHKFVIQNVFSLLLLRVKQKMFFMGVSIFSSFC